MLLEGSSHSAVCRPGDTFRPLLKLLRKFEPIFDGTLGTWDDKPYHIELQKDAKPYHAKPYPVPYKHEKMLRKEVERLCKIGVLKRMNRSEWGSPSFPTPKSE